MKIKVDIEEYEDAEIELNEIKLSCIKTARPDEIWLIADGNPAMKLATVQLSDPEDRTYYPDAMRFGMEVARRWNRARE